jgi:L-ascorbate peroxidase
MSVVSVEALEDQIREFLVELMPVEHGPAHVRLAFHDAGTYDAQTGTGGANGSVHLKEELNRGANSGWGHTCIELLAVANEQFPSASWADLVAIGGAAAIQKCGGPIIRVGLGRTDAVEPAPTHRLPGGYEGAAMLKRLFARMGLDVRDLVVLSGAHTLGHTQRRPFTDDPWVFSNSYFTQLMEASGPTLLGTDTAMIDDPELRPYVELYARDPDQFLTDFAEAYYRLTWLGNQPNAG